MKNNTIILASSSPRRIEMMKARGITPLIVKPNCSEELPYGINMRDAVLFLSLKKALSVEADILSGRVKIPASLEAPYIIAADTVVYKEKIIGKPDSREEALAILKHLRNDVHLVATGVTILKLGVAKRTSFYEATKVFFTDYSNEMLLSYVDTSEPYDKAGAYAIQGTFSTYIDHIEGDFNNVMGFPIDRIEAEFEKLCSLPTKTLLKGEK